jgi:hypothetical protein
VNVLGTIQEDEVHRTDLESDDISVRLGPLVKFMKRLLQRTLVNVIDAKNGGWSWWIPFGSSGAQKVVDEEGSERESDQGKIGAGLRQPAAVQDRIIRGE